MLLAPKVEIQVCIDSGHINKMKEQSFPVLLHFVEYPVSGSELIKNVNATHPLVVVSNTAGLSDVQLDMLTGWCLVFLVTILKACPLWMVEITITTLLSFHCWNNKPS